MEADKVAFLTQERHIMLLLDEINQRAVVDQPEHNFDLLKVVDSLSNTTRGQLHVK